MKGTYFAVVLAVCVLCVHPTAASPFDHMKKVPQFSENFPLFDYVHRPDPTYKWVDTGYRYNESKTMGWTGYLLNLTSQTWLTAQDSDRSVWTHQLVIVVPDKLLDRKLGAMYITGGSNRGSPKPPSAYSEDLLVAATLAVDTGCIVSTLFQVPNQPIVFPSDPTHKSRSEDDAIAWTWVQYVAHRDRPDWVLLLPMVKSAVKAMDAIQEYVAKELDIQLENFAVAGASKRGWTTWLTGAADNQRVVGIMPIVMDMLNFANNIPHMWRAYGGWSFALEPYWAVNVTGYIGTGNMQLIGDIVDPLKYKDYLKMPKLSIDATGDEFFMLDDDHFWWGEMYGESYRLMVQNAEHSMATGLFELIRGARAFLKSLSVGAPRPKLWWDMHGYNGTLDLWTSTEPKDVYLRYAETTDGKRRDFRLIKGNTPEDPCQFIPIKIFGNACLNPIVWLGEKVAPVDVSNGVYHYQAELPVPDGRWLGYFFEVVYKGPGASDFVFTTQAQIIPNTWPFPPCEREGCIGGLV